MPHPDRHSKAWNELIKIGGYGPVPFIIVHRSINTKWKTRSHCLTCNAGAKQAAAEAMPHPGPPPYVRPDAADPQNPETSVYFEHGKKHVVHDGASKWLLLNQWFAESANAVSTNGRCLYIQQVSQVFSCNRKTVCKYLGLRTAQSNSEGPEHLLWHLMGRCVNEGAAH